MSETITFLVQYRGHSTEPWKDDTFRTIDIERAFERKKACAASKIMRGAEFRVIFRTDIPWSQADAKQAEAIAAIDNES